jgi:hypothetical protein
MNEINTAVNAIFKFLFLFASALMGGMMILSAFVGMGDLFVMFLVLFLIFALLSMVKV